jgi:uncharacterized membrane protein
MDNKSRLNRIVYTGLMVAVVFVLTRFTAISFTIGYFNLGDIGIILTGYVLGGFSGMIAGGIGSALADLSAGYLIFVPVTLIVKGIEGYLLGILLNKYRDKIKPLVSIALAMAFMVVGYFIAEAFILGLFDESFGLIVAINDSISTMVQAVISAVVGYALISTGFVKKLLR